MEVQPEDPTQEDLSPEGLRSRLSLPCGIENCAPALPVVFSSNKSSYQYSAQQNLQQNRTSERPQRSHRCYPCAYCPYRSGHKTAVSRHEQIHTGERPFICHEYGQSFTLQHHLANRTLLHSGQKPHVCAECGPCFSQAGSLETHRREQHSAGGALASHLSPRCGKGFKRSGYIKKHLLTHTTEKPYAY